MCLTRMGYRRRTAVLLKSRMGAMGRCCPWLNKYVKKIFIPYLTQADYGFIHCLDGAGDWEAYQRNGVLQYLLDMKGQGVVRHIGLSTHTPALANLVLDSGIVEQLMFSINQIGRAHV